MCGGGLLCHAQNWPLAEWQCVNGREYGLTLFSREGVGDCRVTSCGLTWLWTDYRPWLDRPGPARFHGASPRGRRFLPRPSTGPSTGLVRQGCHLTRTRQNRGLTRTRLRQTAFALTQTKVTRRDARRGGVKLHLCPAASSDVQPAARATATHPIDLCRAAGSDIDINDIQSVQASSKRELIACSVCRIRCG